MMIPQLAFQTPTKIPSVPVSYIEFIKPVEQPQFPDRTKQAAEAVVIRQKDAAEAAAKAAQEAEAKRLADIAAQQAKALYTGPVWVSIGSLTGSYGYAHAGGNCVNEVPPGLLLSGNPISWPVSTNTPYIGGIALFPYNHVARVVGLWSNGDVEVAQQNWSGTPQTRFSRGELRGFR